MNNNNNSEHSIKLYNLVFNNIVIKKIILYHLNKFNILLTTIKFESYEEWQQFKYKQYLNSIILWKNYYLDLDQELNENIKKVTIYSIPPPQYLNHVRMLLKNVDSIEIVSDLNILDFKSSFIQSISSKLNNITFSQQHLAKITLPTIKKLSLQNVLTFEDGCLPVESLNDVFFEDTTPLIINQLSLSKSLVYLDFSNFFSIALGNNVQFPNSLQYLFINCKSFSTALPNHLKTLIINLEEYIHEIQFPSSLEKLCIYFVENKLRHEIFRNCQLAPSSLKYLRFQCSSIVGDDGLSILPEKLEVLFIGDFNQQLLPNQLPSSLNFLQFEDPFNQVIDINVLPSNLKTLVFDKCYMKAINPLAIPSGLKLFSIGNPLYTNPIPLTPSSHPNTAISFHRLNLYYDPSNTQLRVLRLPDIFNEPLSSLRLQDKCNLEYLHLGLSFNHPIEPTDLPSPNNIKTLELCNRFEQTINLEYFQNLETIVINLDEPIKPLITTTTIIDNNNENNNNTTITYNFYKLKNIIIPPNYTQYIKQLDIQFYQFIKLKQ